MNTFLGRFKYYFWMTDPRTVFTSEKELLKAKQLVLGVRANTVTGPVSQEELLHARKLYESAFHPDSGELQNVFGRMSFQVCMKIVMQLRVATDSIEKYSTLREIALLHFLHFEDCSYLRDNK